MAGSSLMVSGVQTASNVNTRGLNLIAADVVIAFHANYFQPQTLGKLETF